LWCCASLARFGISVGLSPEAGILLRPASIERFVIVGLSRTTVGRQRDIRTNLRFVARRVVPRLCEPAPVPLGRTRATTAYSPSEIAAYLALADCQPTYARKMRLQALVCAGAGAGLTGHDLREVTGRDVAPRAGGLVVSVRGRAQRSVPVLAQYHPRLLESATFAGSGYIVGGVARDRHNVTNRLIATVSGGRDLDRLELSRLRATWLVACAERIGLPGFFRAAGFSFSQQLCDLVAAMAVPDDDELVGLLG
jgi:hypothetical protein